MNGVHLVTQEKKTSQNGSKMGRVHRVHCPRSAKAPRPRAARAQRLPASRPAPCRPPMSAPSCRSPACARPPAPVRLPLARASARLQRACPCHARAPSALPHAPAAAARPSAPARAPVPQRPCARLLPSPAPLCAPDA